MKRLNNIKRISKALSRRHIPTVVLLQCIKLPRLKVNYGHL